MKRTANINRLQTEEFDCLIIGGGASGAGCALDSVTRGYRTALIEKTDFAAATSSKSTKLIHGGVRYLEQAFKKFDFAQLAQVKHGLEERHIVLRNAPHLAHPQALITPVFSWFEGLYFTLGLRLYGLFASGKDDLPESEWLSKKQAQERLPGLSDNIHSVVRYYDGQLDDARYCLAIVQTAEAAGTAVANHTEVVDFEKDENGRIVAAIAKDLLSEETFRIKAKVFINCTGPYSDHLRLLANPQLSERLRPSKGVHAILPYQVMGGEDALLIPKTKDGRVVFAIPFYGKLMLGTTDDEYNDLDKEPIIDDKEVGYLLETLAPYVKQEVKADQVLAGFGGLRPLIASDPDTGTKGLVRDHEVEHDKTTNLVSLLGGKWTTYRLMAKDTIDYVSEELISNNRACQTAEQYLVGGEGYQEDNWKNIQQEIQLPEVVCRYLNQHYGNQANTFLNLLQENPDWSQPLIEGYPYLKGEAAFAARYEMACTVRDFLARRIRLEILDWDAAQQAAGIVARVMGKELGWNQGQQISAADDYIDLVYRFREQSQTAVVAR